MKSGGGKESSAPNDGERREKEDRRTKKNIIEISSHLSDVVGISVLTLLGGGGKNPPITTLLLGFKGKKKKTKKKGKVEKTYPTILLCVGKSLKYKALLARHPGNVSRLTFHVLQFSYACEVVPPPRPPDWHFILQAMQLARPLSFGMFRTFQDFSSSFRLSRYLCRPSNNVSVVIMIVFFLKPGSRYVYVFGSILCFCFWPAFTPLPSPFLLEQMSPSDVIGSGKYIF